MTTSLVSVGGGGSSSSAHWPPASLRTIYVIMANNASGDWDQSVRARALRRGWLRSVRPEDVWLHAVRHALYSHDHGKVSGALYFDALSDAVDHLGFAQWYMVCDDDTHVDPVALGDFVQNASARHVYGNVYDRHKVTHCLQASGKYLRRGGGWPTGGSGILLPGAVVRSLAHNPAIPRWASLGKSCRCGDRPLSCALGDLAMAKLTHAPQLFLDSCLYCADFLRPRRILACHAAGAFRNVSRYATDKRFADWKDVNGSFAFRLRWRRSGAQLAYKYTWPTAEDVSADGNARGDRALLVRLSTTERAERMRAVQELLCPPTLDPPPSLYCTPNQTAQDHKELIDTKIMPHLRFRCIVG